jgi:hypothetical protein
MDHRADGGVEAGRKVHLGEFVHQEADRAPVHPVDRQLIGIAAAQGFQHPAIAAQGHDHIGLAGAGLAIAAGHHLQRLPGLGLGRCGEVDLWIGHGQVPLRRPAIKVKSVNDDRMTFPFRRHKLPATGEIPWPMTSNPSA